MKKTGRPLTWLLIALVAVPLLIAPPIIRGLAALRWVEYYGSLDDLPRPHRASARALITKTHTAMRNLAPLPQASDAAIRALEIGQRMEAVERDREAALIIYRGVRDACSSVRARLLSGSGFAVIEARAASLEESLSRESPK